MEILSSQSLWQEYDRKAMPLGVSVISSETVDGKIKERLYFSGERTAMGVTRVFAHLHLPKESHPPVIIVMDDFTSDIADFDARTLTDRGYAVLVLDYAGECEGRERYTIYPKAFDFANYFKHTSEVIKAPAYIKQSCWYVWTTVLMRALTYVESDERLSDSIALMGIGGGANQVLKVAAIEDVKCAVTEFSPGVMDDDAEKDLNFKALLDNSAYAPICKIPVLNIVGSNDRDGYFDRLSAICALTDDKYYLSVGERLDRALTLRQSETVRSWLRRYLKTGLPLEISVPELSARQSEHLLYYEITAATSRHIAGAELYVSYSDGDGEANRNWQKKIPLLAGTGSYIAKVPVYDPSKPIYAYATITYDDNFTFSTPLLVKTPALLGVTAEKLVKSRLLYDSGSGPDDFFSPKGESVTMKSGAFDIDGVCSECGELATYKIGDIKYCAERDSILQLILYSPQPQEVEFTVRTVEDDELAEYVGRRKIEGDSSWTKLTLSPDDF